MANPPDIANKKSVDAFLEKAAELPTRTPRDKIARLFFALDATASRQPTWDQACHIQSVMFQEVSTIGRLAIKLCYYRGFLDLTCSGWIDNPQRLQSLMQQVYCQAGTTQIHRVLEEIIRESKNEQINAAVFIGDAIEEDVLLLNKLAGEMKIRAIPLFIFHEGHDPRVVDVFANLARLSGGACCPFDLYSGEQLKKLLRAVAIYAVGGRLALKRYATNEGGSLLQLSHQILF